MILDDCINPDRKGCNVSRYMVEKQPISDYDCFGFWRCIRESFMVPISYAQFMKTPTNRAQLDLKILKFRKGDSIMYQSIYT